MYVVIKNLVVIPSRNDLLASGTQNDGVLELGSVTALDVAQRRVVVYDSLVTQIL